MIADSLESTLQRQGVLSARLSAADKTPAWTWQVAFSKVRLATARHFGADGATPGRAGHGRRGRRCGMRHRWMRRGMVAMVTGVAMAGAGSPQRIYRPERGRQPTHHTQLQQQAEYACPSAAQTEKRGTRQQDGEQHAHDSLPVIIRSLPVGHSAPPHAWPILVGSAQLTHHKTCRHRLTGDTRPPEGRDERNLAHGLTGNA